MISQSKTRRFYTQSREEHNRIRGAILKSGVTIMSGNTGSAFYVPSIKTKYVPVWQCLDWFGEKMLPGEIARRELERHFTDLHKIKNWRGNHIKLLRKRWPMFCDGQSKCEMVYFDLVGAYWQFYGRLWLDVAYPAGYGTLDLAPVADALVNIKTARNAVIGITRSTSISMQKLGRSFTVPSKNRFLSPPLWANLMGWLQEIASEALRRGAVYCMMDGFFIPSTCDASGFQSFLDDYGIAYRKQTGEVHIRGWGSYSTDWGRTTHLYLKGGRGRVNMVAQHFDDNYKILNWWLKAIDFRMWRYDHART